jgi:hypothetical protein
VIGARELALRRRIFEAFAATGAPPEVEDEPALRSLAAQHVVVPDEEDGGGAVRVRMAHPFAGHREGCRVDAGGRTWWGNCAWDGLGIVAALGLSEATVASHGVTLRVSGDSVEGDALFHVAVPARHWWDDIAFT